MTEYGIKPGMYSVTRPNNWQVICDSLANYEAKLNAMSETDRVALVRNNLSLADSIATTTFPFQS